MKAANLNRERMMVVERTTTPSSFDHRPCDSYDEAEMLCCNYVNSGFVSEIYLHTPSSQYYVFFVKRAF